MSPIERRIGDILDMIASADHFSGLKEEVILSKMNELDVDRAVTMTILSELERQKLAERFFIDRQHKCPCWKLTLDGQRKRFFGAIP